MSTDTEIMAEMAKAMRESDQREERGIPDASQSTGLKMSQKTKGASGPEVPGRIRAWRTDDGREVWLPAVTQLYHLRKTRPNGEPVFVLTKPEMAQRIPLDISCSICARVNGASRKFYQMTQYEDHMEILHPREWQREQREIDRRERHEERQVLAALATGGRNGNQEPTTIRQISYACETCGKSFSKKVALAGHRRTHV